jgi:hypothetical protein
MTIREEPLMAWIADHHRGAGNCRPDRGADVTVVFSEGVSPENDSEAAQKAASF